MTIVAKKPVPLIDLTEPHDDDTMSCLSSEVLLSSQNETLKKLLEGDPDEESVGLLPAPKKTKKLNPPEGTPKTGGIDYAIMGVLADGSAVGDQPLLPKHWGDLQSTLKEKALERKKGSKKKGGPKKKAASKKGAGKKTKKKNPSVTQVFLKREHSKAYHGEYTISIENGMSEDRAKQKAGEKGRTRTKELRDKITSGEVVPVL